MNIMKKPAKHIIGLITRRDVEALRVAVEMLPDNGTIVEVGTFTGKSTVAIAEACERQGKRYDIHTIDRFIGLNVILGRAKLLADDEYRNKVINQLGYTLDQILEYACRPNLIKYVVNNFTLTAKEQWDKFLENTRGYDNIVVYKEHFDPKDFQWVLAADMVFYDGDHTAESTYDALVFWEKKLKENGILVVHDYEPAHPGCVEAVDRFVSERGKKVIVPTKSTVAIIC